MISLRLEYHRASKRWERAQQRLKERPWQGAANNEFDRAKDWWADVNNRVYAVNKDIVVGDLLQSPIRLWLTVPTR